MVFGGNLHTDLQILTDVSRQHGTQAFNRILNGQRAEVIDKPLWEVYSNVKVVILQVCNM